MFGYFGLIFLIPDCLEEDILTLVDGKYKIPYCKTESLAREPEGNAET